MDNALQKLFPVLLLIALGYFLQRRNYFEETAFQRIQRFVLDICIPCMLFTSFINFELDWSCLSAAVSFFVLMCLYMGSGFIIVKVFRLQTDFFPFFLSAFGVGFMALPLFATTFGIENLGYMAVFAVGHELFVALIFLPLLQIRMAGMKVNVRSVVKSLLTPQMIMVVAGLLINSLGFRPTIDASFVGNALISGIEMLGSLTLALTMVMVGYRIRFDDKNRLGTAAMYALARLVIALGLGIIWKTAVIDLLAAGSALTASPLFDHAFFSIIIQHSSLILVMYVGRYRGPVDQEILNNATVLTLISGLLLYIGYLTVFV